MILCLDVGNSQIYGGLFKDEKLLFTFRKTSKDGASSDETGLFLRGVLRENNCDPKSIQKIAICTVVPDLIHSLVNCSKKYFNVTPFIFGPGVKTGLKIKYHNPLEVGADRIANSVAAVDMFSNKNLIIVDFGTATTFCAINSKKEYLGGLIIAGLRISMEALEARTAKLPSVEIVKPKNVIGRSTVESIQSGLYHSHLGAVIHIKDLIAKENFDSEKSVVIGTGGFSRLFEKSGVFDAIVPDLVLNGLLRSLKMNS